MDRLDRARETAGGASHPVPGGMIETAENLRKAYGISREEQDELAVRSHHRAVAAHEAGKFADELVPVTVPGKRGKPDTVVDRDENPRADATVEGLGALRPIRVKLDPESTVTAGNASGQNDGAAMCVVTTRAEAESTGSHTAFGAALLGGHRLRPGGHGHRPRQRHRRRPRPRRPDPRRAST